MSETFDKEMNEEVKNPIECLLDENNTEPIVLFNEKGEKIEFEQIALIPLEDNKENTTEESEPKIYAILKPIKTMEGVGEDEALVFEIVEPEDDEEEYLNLVTDLYVIDRVFKVYNKLCDESGIV